MLMDEETEVILSSRYIPYYEKLGYIIPKHNNGYGRMTVKEGTKIIVLIRDLPKYSNVKIPCKCDGCGKEYNIRYCDYINYKREDGKIFCKNCCFLGYFYSIGQWMLDNNLDINKYWSNKNIKSPFDISYGSIKECFYVICQEKEYHEDYLITSPHFREGKRCPYCSSRKIHIKDSLGSIYPKSLDVWAIENKQSPFEVGKKCSKKVLWKCENEKHENYYRTIPNAVKYDFRCPECTKERKESFLQERIRLYLCSMRYTILHENNCTLRPKNPKTEFNLYYDNEIKELKLIIETMGAQHSREIACWNKNESGKLENIQFRDNYKKQYALDNGYYYLDIWYYHDNAEGVWKTLIDNKIKEILEL